MNGMAIHDGKYQDGLFLRQTLQQVDRGRVQLIKFPDGNFVHRLRPICDPNFQVSGSPGPFSPTASSLLQKKTDTGLGMNGEKSAGEVTKAKILIN